MNLKKHQETVNMLTLARWRVVRQSRCATVDEQYLRTYNHLIKIMFAFIA